MIDYPEYITLDIETDIKNRGDEAIGTFKATPYNSLNKIIMIGAKHCDVSEVQVWHGMGLDTMPVPSIETVVVGHNLSFDLAYMFRDYETWYKWSAQGMIWDTMLVDYILSGQERKFTPLNTVSKEAGGTIKDRRMEEYWDNDVDTGDIPYEELEEYLIHDVNNTELVFLKQVAEVEERGMMPLVRTMMEARMATIEMERNGMFIKRRIVDEQGAALQEDIDSVVATIFNILKLSFPRESWDSLNINSTAVISNYLFGGTHKYKIQQPKIDPKSKMELRYKSGPRKDEIVMRWVEKTGEIMGKFQGTVYSTRGVKTWATGDAVLSKILKDYKHSSTPKPMPVVIVEHMKKARGMNKDMTAYYKGYAKLIWPNGILHPQYHHCSTDTGRLSCSKPNLQQASGK